MGVGAGGGGGIMVSTTADYTCWQIVNPAPLAAPSLISSVSRRESELPQSCLHYLLPSARELTQPVILSPKLCACFIFTVNYLYNLNSNTNNCFSQVFVERVSYFNWYGTVLLSKSCSDFKLSVLSVRYA